MKTYLALIFVFSISNCYSEEFKLQCDLTVKTFHTSGLVENEIESAIVEITSTETFLSIFVDGSEPLISIGYSTRFPTPSRVLSEQNHSDKNRWYLTNVTKSQKAGRPNSTNTISIDRNTGYLSYQRDFENGRVYTTGAGYCKKIDTTERKF